MLAEVPRDHPRVAVVAAPSSAGHRDGNLRALIPGVVLRICDARERESNGRRSSKHYSDMSKHRSFRHFYPSAAGFIVGVTGFIVGVV
jgi:hypothetical protein